MTTYLLNNCFVLLSDRSAIRRELPKLSAVLVQFLTFALGSESAVLQCAPSTNATDPADARQAVRGLLFRSQLSWLFQRAET